MASSCVVVRNRLLQQWKVQTPDDWLEACVEWIHSENGDARLSSAELSNMVFEQWLLCDLREIEASCLPPQLSEQQKIDLNGTFCLQVNVVVDVSKPYYGQIQAVSGTENANVHISATQFTQTQEVVSGRMLMLEMTDGTQSVRGMEYQPIPAINVNMAPGVKVVIQGPVLCRLGVLMLTKKNMTVLGGEVDTLTEENAKLSVLQRVLAQNTNEGQPRRDLPKKTFESKPLIRQGGSQAHSTATNQNLSGYRLTQGNNSKLSRTPKTETMMEDDDDDFFNQMDPAQLDALEQQWEDDSVDYEQIMEEMEEEDQNKRESRQESIIPPQNPHTRSGSSTNSNINSDSRASFGSKFDNNPREVSRKRNSSNSSGGANKKNMNSGSCFSSNVTQDKHSNVTAQSMCRRPNSMTVNPIVIKPRDSGAQLVQRLNPGCSNTGQSGSNRVGLSKKVALGSANTASIKIEDVMFDDDDFDMDLVLNKHTGKSTGGQQVPVKSETQAPKPKLTQTSLNFSLKSSNINAALPKPAKQRKTQPVEDFPDDDFDLLEIEHSSLNVAKTGLSAVKQMEDKYGLHSSPFTYLKVVQENLPSRTLQYVRVKAYVSTLLSRLEHNNGAFWSLQAKLNDGTTALDVELSDEVLTSLIGFTSQQCHVMKDEAKSNKSIRLKLAMGIKKCQQSLVQLSSLMELQLVANVMQPKVTRLLTLTHEDIAALQQRTSYH